MEPIFEEFLFERRESDQAKANRQKAQADAKANDPNRKDQVQKMTKKYDDKNPESRQLRDKVANAKRAKSDDAESVKELKKQGIDVNNLKCKKCGSGKNVQVDHVQQHTNAKYTGSEHLQALCNKCHQEKTKTEREKRGQTVNQFESFDANLNHALSFMAEAASDEDKEREKWKKHRRGDKQTVSDPQAKWREGGSATSAWAALNAHSRASGRVHGRKQIFKGTGEDASFPVLYYLPHPQYPDDVNVVVDHVSSKINPVFGVPNKLIDSVVQDLKRVATPIKRIVVESPIDNISQIEIEGDVIEIVDSTLSEIQLHGENPILLTGYTAKTENAVYSIKDFRSNEIIEGYPLPAVGNIFKFITSDGIIEIDLNEMLSQKGEQGHKWLRWGSPSFEQPPIAMHYIDLSSETGGVSEQPPEIEQRKKLYIQSYGKEAYQEAQKKAQQAAGKHQDEYKNTLPKDLDSVEADQLVSYEFYRIYWDTLFNLLKTKSAVSGTLSDATHYRIWKAAEEHADVALDQEHERILKTRTTVINNYKEAATTIEKLGLPVLIRAAQGTSAQWGATDPEATKINRELELAYRNRKLALADAKNLELAYKQHKISQDEKDSKSLKVKARLAQLDKVIAEFKARLQAAETAPREEGEMATALRDGQLIEGPEDLQTFWQTNAKGNEARFSVSKELTDEEWEKLHVWHAENRKKIYKELYDQELEEITQSGAGDEPDTMNIKTEKRQMGRPIIKDPNTGEARQDLQGKVSLYVNKLVDNICEKSPSKNPDQLIYHFSDLRLMNQDDLSDADLELLRSLIPTFANTPQTKVDVHAAQEVTSSAISARAKKEYEKDKKEAYEKDKKDEWPNWDELGDKGLIKQNAKEGERFKGTDAETINNYTNKAKKLIAKEKQSKNEGANIAGSLLVEVGNKKKKPKIDHTLSLNEESYSVPYDAEIPKPLIASLKEKSTPDYHIKVKSAVMIGPNGEKQVVDTSKTATNIVINKSSIIGEPTDSDQGYWDSVKKVLNNIYHVETFNTQTQEHEVKEYELSDVMKQYFGTKMGVPTDSKNPASAPAEPVEGHSHRTKYQSLYLNDQGLNANNFYEIVGAGPEMKWAALESTTVTRSPNRVGIFINKRNSPLDQIDITGNIIKAKTTGWNKLLRPSVDYDENTGIRRRESDIKKTVKEKTYAPREFKFTSYSSKEIQDKINNHKARYGSKKDRENYVDGHFELMWADTKRGPHLKGSAVSRLIHQRAMARAVDTGVAWTGTGPEAEKIRESLYQYAETDVKKQKMEDPAKFEQELKTVANTIYLERYVDAVQQLVGIQDDVCTTCMGSGFIKVYSSGAKPSVSGTTSTSLHKGIGSDYKVVPAKKEEYDNLDVRKHQAIQKCYACRVSPGSNPDTVGNKTAVFLGRAESRIDKDTLNSAISDAVKTSLIPPIFSVYLSPNDYDDELVSLMDKIKNLVVVGPNNKMVDPQPETAAQKVELAVDKGGKLRVLQQDLTKRYLAGEMGDDPEKFLISKFQKLYGNYGTVSVSTPGALPGLASKLTSAIFPASLRNTVKTKIPLTVVSPLIKRLAKANIDYMNGNDDAKVIPKGYLALKRTVEGLVQYMDGEQELPFGFNPADKRRAITVQELAEMFKGQAPVEPVYIEIKDDPDTYVLGQIVNLINNQYGDRKGSDHTFKTMLGVAASKLSQYKTNHFSKMAVTDRKEIEDAIASILDSDDRDLEMKLDPSRTKKIIQVDQVRETYKGLYEVSDLYETAKRFAAADGHPDLEISEIKDSEYPAMHAEMGQHGNSLGDEMSYKFYINLAKAAFTVASEESLTINELIERYSDNKNMRHLLLDTMNRPFISNLGNTMDVVKAGLVIVKGKDAVTGQKITLQYDISEYRDQPGEGTKEIPAVFLVKNMDQLKSGTGPETGKKPGKKPTQSPKTQIAAELSPEQFAEQFKVSKEPTQDIARIISAVNQKHLSDAGLRHRLRLIGTSGTAIQEILKKLGSVRERVTPTELAEIALASMKKPVKSKPKNLEMEAEERRWADIDVISEGISEDIDGPDSNPVHRLNVDDIAEMLDD